MQCAVDESARRDALIRACVGPTESYVTRTNWIFKVRIMPWTTYVRRYVSWVPRSSVSPSSSFPFHFWSLKSEKECVGEKERERESERKRKKKKSRRTFEAYHDRLLWNLSLEVEFSQLIFVFSCFFLFCTFYNSCVPYNYRFSILQFFM